MIAYINVRCSQWAEWIRRGDDAGLGFPRQVPYTRLDGRAPGKVTQPPVDEAAWQIDRSVRALAVDLNKAIVVFYLSRGTSFQKARDCRCSPSVLYDRVHIAHCRILEWLNDETAGVLHPEPLKKRLASSL